MKMKSLLQTTIIFCGVSLGVRIAHAQPETPSKNTTAIQSARNFKPTDGNLKATAMMGAFYNTILRASSYRGHFVITKTIVKDKKVVRKKVVDWQSAWLGDGDGGFKSRVAEGTFTTVEGDGVAAKTMVEKVNMVDDGETRRTLDPVRNIWSERKRPIGEPDMATILTRAAWTTMLLAFNLGNEFKVSNLSATEPAGFVVANQTNDFEFVFDAVTGNLRLWRISSNNGETTELRWSELELNQPVAPKVFEWAAPVGARQVPPEDNERKLDF